MTDGILDLFHGTSLANAESIQRDGFRAGSHFTDKLEIAQRYASRFVRNSAPRYVNRFGDPAVLHVRIAASNCRQSRHVFSLILPDHVAALDFVPAGMVQVVGLVDISEYLASLAEMKERQRNG